MIISEARQLYRTQIQSYQEQQLTLSKRKKELEEKIKATDDGKTLYANEAATLELSLEAVTAKKDEYMKYMSDLNEQWAAVSNMVSSEQQADAMEEYTEDMGKIMEVARRLMKGDIVPPGDEKKLMEYSMELYQAAKNIGSLMKQKERKEHDSLWEDEEEKNYEDPTEVADNTEAVGGAPEIVDVADTLASVEATE